MRIIAAIIVLGVWLSGCAGAPSAQVGTARQRNADVRPVCMSTRQCEAMWAAARNWITSAYCGCKIKTMSDSYIETCDSVGNSTVLACSVTKVSRPEGGYQFIAKAHCANWFACFPPATDAVLNFNAKVTSAGTDFVQ